MVAAWGHVRAYVDMPFLHTLAATHSAENDISGVVLLEITEDDLVEDMVRRCAIAWCYAVRLAAVTSHLISALLPSAPMIVAMQICHNSRAVALCGSNICHACPPEAPSLEEDTRGKRGRRGCVWLHLFVRLVANRARMCCWVCSTAGSRPRRSQGYN